MLFFPFSCDLPPPAQTIKIQYLISHLLFAALMDVSWSFGREPQRLPSGVHPFSVQSLASGAAAGRTEEGHVQNKLYVQKQEPWSWCVKVRTDTEIPTEGKQSSVELIDDGYCTNTLKPHATKPQPILKAGSGLLSDLLRTDCLSITSHTYKLNT